MDEKYQQIQGMRVRQARGAAMLSQPAFAEKLTAELGFYFGDAAKVSRIEKGKQDVTSRELAAISVVLGQPVPWLQGTRDDGFEAPPIRFDLLREKSGLRILGLTTHRPLLRAA